MADMTWAEAVSELVGACNKAEASVALLKRFGEPGQQTQAQRSYAEGKTHADAVVAGLTVALSAAGRPERLSSLLERIEHVHLEVVKLRTLAQGQLPRLEGAKNPGEILENPFGETLEPMSDAVAALYTKFRANDEPTRKTIQRQLEAAHWQDFERVRMAQAAEG
jgi:hypothetical protein